MLQTKNVFIDTQYFVKSGLHFDNSALKAFKQYCKDEQLCHIMTSVVEREVESKIKLSVKDAISAIQTFRRKARILSSLNDEHIKGLFYEVVEEDIYLKASKVFQDFLRECETELVDASEVDAEDVLNLYFECKPPFGDGKKKTEFPDALSLYSLKSWLGGEERIYVVSDDGDLKSFCDSEPNFLIVESLDKLLDIYTQHTNVRAEQVKKYLTDHEDDIREKIKDYLEECDVYNSSTWEDAEVDGGLSVTDIGEIDPSVIYIDDEGSRITFDVNVHYEVTVVGPDFINGIYDREEGRVFTFGTTSRTEELSDYYTVEIYFSYEFIDGKLENAEIEDLFIEGVSRGIEVAVEESGNDW